MKGRRGGPAWPGPFLSNNRVFFFVKHDLGVSRKSSLTFKYPGHFPGKTHGFMGERESCKL